MTASRHTAFEVRAIGHVESPLVGRAAAPRQGDEGGPDAWLVFDEDVAEALQGVGVGDDLLLLTWLDRADRTTLLTHPRDEPQRPLRGVFSTRSPDRPNPIGLHRARVRAMDGLRMFVGPLEAIDQTPIIDVKPAIGPSDR